MLKINPILLTDSYKLSHKSMEVPGTSKIYSNFTPRSTKYFKKLFNDFDDHIVWYGLQAFIKKILIDTWNDNFFDRPKSEVIEEAKKILMPYIGMSDLSHFEKLHDLGYLPIKIKALKEGQLVTPGIPCLTIENTEEGFEWLPNYLETIISAELWKPMTVATIAKQFYDLSNKFADETCDNREHVMFQNHDFSFRGQSSFESSASTGSAFLIYSRGTNNVPALDFINRYYGNGEYANSIIAGEHSVTTLGINYFNSEDLKDGELQYLNYLLDKFNDQFISYVADSYDYFGFLTNVLPMVKDKVNSMTGKLVVRPDSGDPVEVVCGKETSKPLNEQTSEEKGSIQLLWELFGGEINSKGYKVLNPKIGLIYGDGITYERAKQIMQKLKDKGFASSNVVFGIGSYTLASSISRDSLGIAIKATNATVNKKEIALFKAPKGDNSKKSLKGYLKVTKESDGLQVYDNVSYEESNKGLLIPVFENGKLLNEITFNEICNNLK